MSLVCEIRIAVDGLDQRSALPVRSKARAEGRGQRERPAVSGPFGILIGFQSGATFGSNAAKLLETIVRTGSVRASAATLGITRYAARSQIEEIQVLLRAPVLKTLSGGRKGGGSALTDLGREVLTAFRALEVKSARAAASELRLLRRLTKSR